MSLATIIRGLRLAVLPIAIIAFVAALGILFYLRAEALMAEQLRQRLQSTASIAAMQFDPAVIDRVRSESDAGSPAHRRLVDALQYIRANTSGVAFAYLVRATDDPSTVLFIADADEFRSDAELDVNGDGIVDNDEAPGTPGEEYDVAGMTEFQQGFTMPSVDRHVTTDKWGSFISGYAPVVDDAGNTVAVLGIDMNARAFVDATRSIFSPVGLLLVMIAGVLLAFLIFSAFQRRRMEAMRQLEQDRSALMDLTVHQLGMPLATFRWWVELLREDPAALCSSSSEPLDHLQVGVDRMNAIIQSLQEATRLQSGTMVYKPESTDMESFVRSVVDDMRSAFELKKQMVEVKADSPLPLVRIDRKIMHGVLAELLENARSYSPDGGTVTVRVFAQRRYVCFEVIDHGCGIPAEDIPRVMQQFTRASNAYCMKPVGNGLGLFICKGIVERAGGRIALRSKEGVGTTVSISLPRAQ